MKNNEQFAGPCYETCKISAVPELEMSHSLVQHLLPDLLVNMKCRCSIVSSQVGVMTQLLLLIASRVLVVPVSPRVSHHV